MENKIPTIKDIAEKLNISVSTVSRALHNHPSIGLRTKSRVQDLAKELNYEPNQAAISFKQGRTSTIGVLLPNLSEAFFSSAISGIEDIAYKNNYNILMGQSLDDTDREKRIIETMKNHRVDGMLVSIAKNTITYDHFEMLKKYNIPIVFFDRMPKMQKVHFIGCNIEAGMIEAINFLIKQGHRQIAFINGPNSLQASKERLDGYMKGMQKNRIKIDMQLVYNSNLTKDSTSIAMQEILAKKKRPTAIVAFNDYVALDAMVYAKNNKIKINKDISFVSFANMPIWNFIDNQPIASIEQFPYQQGERAMQMMLQLLETNEEDALDIPTSYNIIFDSQFLIHKV